MNILLFRPLWIFSVILSISTTVFAGKYPTNIINLDGIWKVAIDSENAGKEHNWSNSIRPNARDVVMPGDIHLAYPGYRGVVWLWKKVTVPSNKHDGGVYLLHFKSGSVSTELWVNGQYVGIDYCYNNPMTVNVTKYIKPRVENLFTVRIIDPPADKQIDNMLEGNVPGEKLWIFTGFEDSVELQIRSQVRIEDIFSRAYPEDGSIRIQTTVVNSGKTSRDVKIKYSIDAVREMITFNNLEKDITVEPGNNLIEETIKVEGHKLWSLEDPYLYRVSVSVENDKSMDEKTVRVGFRDFRIEDGHFKLNGKRIYIKCAHTGYETPVGNRVPTVNSDYHRRDIYMAKSAGYNSIRMFQSPPNQQTLDFCDEIGFMAMVEPRGGWLYDDGPYMWDRYKTSIDKTLKRDRNHPSVTMWGLLNEHPWALGDSDQFRKTVAYLPQMRKLDDSRLILLGSGRWDCDPSVGSVSNPDSNHWDYLLGIDEPGAEKIEPHCGVGGPPGGPDRPIAGYTGNLGDIHLYPPYPLTEPISHFLRTVANGTKNVFVSEMGVISSMDIPRSIRRLEQYGYPNCVFARNFEGKYKAFLKDWENWEMSKTFGREEDFFDQSIALNAERRLTMLNATRANPSIIGFSMTAMVDTRGSGEGVFDMFRQWKPKMVDALQDGWASLRWCMFAEPVNLYRGEKVKLEAILANEEALKPGNYPVVVEVFGPNNEKVFSEKRTVKIPNNYQQLPLAMEVFENEFTADVPTGKYRLIARFEKGAAAVAGKAATFYVSEKPEKVILEYPVTIWEQDEQLEQVLRKAGIDVRKFNPKSLTRDIVIAAGKVNGNKAKNLRQLMKSVAGGSNVIFVDPAIFRDRAQSNAFVPLKQKGRIIGKTQTSYHNPHETWSRNNHLVFEGLPSGGMLDEVFYRDLFSNIFWMDQELPAEIIAAATTTSSTYFSTTRIAVHNFGKGKFVLNTFRIKENLGKHPGADRLLLNLIKYMQTGLDKPSATLPEDIETILDGLGLKSVELATDGLETWYTETINEYLTIQYNPTDYDISDFGIVWPSQAISMHPSPAGQYAALQWRVPANGKYQVEVKFNGGSVTRPTTTYVYVCQDDQMLMEDKINLDGKGNEAVYTSEHIEMKHGQKISFIVGNGNQNASSDATVTKIKISAIQQFASDSWDPAKDFNLKKNPNGMWCYGYLPKAENPQPLKFKLFKNTR